ncbi:MAG: hypothetical protein V2I33_21045, partial [Kangiellaceae bacterium]|nr:hypothetical protein [Kangiellaceae bacterium]
MIEYVIILFPAFNVISATPLIAIILSQTMESFFPNAAKATKVSFRVLVWVIPTVIAILTHNLGLIGAICGIPNYFLVFGLGSVLHVVSRARIPAKWRGSGFQSSTVIAWFNIAFCTVATIYTTVYIG